MDNCFLLRALFCFLLHVLIVRARTIEDDIKNYPNVIKFGIEKADEAAIKESIQLNFRKVLYFIISEEQEIKKYTVTFRYVSKQGHFKPITVIIIENPCGELTLNELFSPNYLLFKAIPDIKEYEPILLFAQDKSNEILQSKNKPFRFSNVLSFDIVEDRNGSEYPLTLEYLSMDGLQQIHKMTIHENMEGRLSLINFEDKSPINMENSKFLGFN